MSHNYKSVIKWDDLRTPANATSAIGSNPPDYAQFQNDGLGSVTSFGVAQAAGSSELSVSPSYLDADSNHAISMWFKTDNNGNDNYWMWHTGDFNYRVQLENGQGIRVARNNEETWNANANWLVGSTNHLVINVFTSGGSRIYECYVNGQLQDSYDEVGTLQTGSNNSELNFGRRPVGSSESFSGIMDAIYVFSGLADRAPLTVNDVQTLYNDGAGITTAINPANSTLLAYYPMDEGSGTTIDNAEGTGARDLTINGLGSSSFWVSGLVGGGSRGVFGYHFSPDRTEELYFDVQLPHRYKEGTDLEPHLHWSPKVAGNLGDQVIWGLEYTISNVGGTFGTTVTLSGVQRFPNDDPLVAYRHYATKLGTIPGNDLNVSSMIKCRLFRITSSPADTFGFDAVLHEFDLHFQVDGHGSDEEFEKHGI